MSRVVFVAFSPILAFAACDPDLVGARCERDEDCLAEGKVCDFDIGRCVPLENIGFGGKVTYVSDRSGAGEVWVMNDDGTGRRRITNGAEKPGTTWGAHHPRWSPGGDWIAFYYGCSTGGEDDPTSSRYIRVRPDGSGFDALSDHALSEGSQISWTQDGQALLIAVHRVCDDYIDRLDLTTGEHAILIEDSKDGYPCVKAVDANPAFPDLVAFRAYACGGDNGGIRVLDLGLDEEMTPVGPDKDALAPRWSADGVLLSWSEDKGDSIWISDQEGNQADLVEPALAGEGDILSGPEWADGGFVFNVDQGSGSSIWICDRDGRHARPILSDQQFNLSPDWFPGRLPDFDQAACEAHGGRWDRDGRGGQGCWLVSALDQSCTEACTDHGLMCDPGDWNDTPACDLCTLLTGEPKSTVNNPDHGGGAPCLFVPSGSSHGCYYRSEKFHQDCDASGGSRIRLCVCRPFD